MGFLRGRMPIRNTLYYLNKGDIFLREEVQVLSLGYHSKKKTSKGAEDFVFWHWAQLQYKNPDVQLVKYLDISPNPFIQAFLSDGEEVLMDLYGKDRQQICDQIDKVLGKTDLVLAREGLVQKRIDNPANFGIGCDRQCACEIPGQMPCPKLMPAPRYMTGEWRYQKDKWG